MPKDPPESTQHDLRRRLNRHACRHWRQVDAIRVHFRAGFAHVAAELPGDPTIPLLRLRFTGVVDVRGFALHSAGRSREGPPHGTAVSRSRPARCGASRRSGRGPSGRSR
ncbi:hypothetical protein SGR_761 [Streptomyces griseus subsp. griseus NBRC 13350]|uniref:Uncharacterized protein n=1 Tax=Streptomyces griseus subsp. griseus (strain JCM 4626 / CBS 651.72 / NBRC 13350 / KCC S-0626 / ISP 5235) TaxID=455632 RepID=B1VSN6_STRGG|nr:hypothetical protein SGR_761 [Streptomyces griseus subsp. griseus NBRC 13350]